MGFFKAWVFLFLVVGVVEISSFPFLQDDALNCGYESCHEVDPNKINVHLIPHSHDDVGWLKTVDQYYFGSKSDIQKAGVQYIITSTVEALKANPDRRFIQVESAFFWKWWQRQSDEIKQDVQNLVNNGQLEIINAAWSMNDEAAVNYQSTIDQFTWGLRFINDTLGACGVPKIGWQIDPFGHSREQASIFARLGYNGVFFARIDYKDKEQRINDQNLEVIWKGSANLDNTNIFTNMFPDFYGNPSGFCFDINCGDTVMVDDERSLDYNVPARVEEFEGIINGWSEYYRTNNILVPMGGDFQYQSAEVNYINMDRLIKGFENHDSIKVLYSTPSCYIKAVNDEATSKNVAFVQKTDDFFPYGSDEHCYWTGYFTSRPNAKRFERTANNVLQAAKQLSAIARLNGDDYDDSITPLRQAVGVLQHHDAITGTAKQAVANDYARLLTKTIKQAAGVAGTIITDLLKIDSSTDVDLKLSTCLLTNVSICSNSQLDRFTVAVYNPLARSVTHNVRLPVGDSSYKITGPDGEEVNDVLDKIASFDYISGIDDGSPSEKDLVFVAKDLPPLGTKLYYFEKTASAAKSLKTDKKLRYGTDTTSFEIDSESGLLSSVTINGKTLEITQNFYYYNGSNGDNNGNENRASGAYIFRPITDATPITTDPVKVTVTEGELVDEVRQEFNEWVKQIIRVYKSDGNNYIEFDWLVGNIHVDNDLGIGKEIISKFTVKDFANNGEFYTDSNGREMIKRTINKRYDYEYDSTLEPVASNYYPVTSKVVIKDEDQKLEVAVLNDRSQGGGAIQDGSIELMVHRRLLRDDGKGVGEALNDKEFDHGVIARGQHYLVIGSSESDGGDAKSTAAQERELALEKLLQPLILVGDATDDAQSLDNLQSQLNFNYSPLSKTLDDNVNLMTFEAWKDETYIIRLEHILEKDEDSTLSADVVVDLTDLLSDYQINEIRETTLGANQWLDEFENKDKLVWNIENSEKVSYVKKTSDIKDDALQVTLTPMQIRTFIASVSKK